MTEKATARAQAAGVLTMVALVGAMLGVVGDRLLAQQRDDRETVAQQTPDSRQGRAVNDSVTHADDLPAGGGADAVPSPADPPGPEPSPAPADEPPLPMSALPQPLANAPRYAERMATRLDLTEAQRNAIDAIVEEERIRIRELTMQLQPQFMAIARQTQQRIDALLTPEQRRQFRLMRQARVQETLEERVRQMEPMRRGSGMDAPGTPGGPPQPMPPRQQMRPQGPGQPPRTQEEMQARREMMMQRLLGPEQRIRARIIQDSLNLPIADTVRFRLRAELRQIRDSAGR